jgi:predicted adenine nucleotide alpha hydrolase (AANH) superfamily ATPase
MKQLTNYQKELDNTIKALDQQVKVPTLLIHSCCAPCSSYVLEYLSSYFHITVLYYNPNIFPPEEYSSRVAEQKRLIELLPAKHPIQLTEGRYQPEEFYTVTKGFEREKEGEERCFRCYRLRLKETATYAKEANFDYFTTTLSISPLKKAAKLNEIGEELAREYGVSYLLSDFKKREGYKRSIQLSKEYDLYRQNYCGCVYSKINS